MNRPSKPRFPLSWNQVSAPAAPQARVGQSKDADRATRSGPLDTALTPPPDQVRDRALLRPQRLLEQAAQDDRRQRVPTGVGLDSERVRSHMARRLLEQGCCGERVAWVMAQVPRHAFVDTALVIQAYEDTSLPIGWGQTISKPSVVARMLELVSQGQQAQRQGHLGRVLEIGTGCGYAALLLAGLAPQVDSLERLEPLHRQAQERVAVLHRELSQTHPGRWGRLQLHHGDGTQGRTQSGPYDTIVSAAGGQEVPQAWLDQLALGGRLVAPMLNPQTGQQALICIDRSPTGYTRHQHETVRFVPLKSGLA